MLNNLQILCNICHRTLNPRLCNTPALQEMENGCLAKKTMIFLTFVCSSCKTVQAQCSSFIILWPVFVQILKLLIAQTKIVLKICMQKEHQAQRLLCSIRTFCPEGPFLHLQFAFIVTIGNNEEVIIGKCLALYILSSWFGER